MANLLSMAKIDSILTLHQRNWSIRRIAKELGLHRDTVARHLRLLEQTAPAAAPEADVSLVKIGQAPLGAPPVKIGQAPLGAEQPKMGQAPLGVEGPTARTPSPSLCEPFRALILEQLSAGLTAQRIFQDLVRDHGFAGKYHSVRRFVRRLSQGRPLPFRRMECAPGEEAQVDFGTGAPILLADGKRRRTHVFRIVLSHSRRGYSEAVYRQTTDEFIRCLENAFGHFGGVPKVLVPDNLKAAVEQADWFDPDLNPKLRLFAEHYGLAIVPTRPRLPRHKGKIESGVDYVKSNGLRGLTFPSLEEENRHLLHWETTVADVRIHGTIRQQVGKVFAEVERPALLPLPATRFPFFHEARRSVHRDGHVEVAHAYYSVPPEYLGWRVWVRWDGHLVRIFNERLEPIACHAQREPGKFSTQRAHLAAEKISGVERGAAWLLSQTRRIGTQAARWSEAVVQTRGVEGVRVLQGLLHLAGRHPREALEKACAIAFSYGSYRLRTL
ncbi:MAG TPA: IS21 family transposase, partial [Gemmataceae bacterium]|nr:IS21 family transposase [Gemmataceae bacterium]